MIRPGTIFFFAVCTLGILCSFEWETSRKTPDNLPAGDSLGAPVDSMEVVIDSLIYFARQYIGTPYRYGGRGPERFDCSGYTSHVFRSVEVSLPFSSRAQVLMGSQVPLDSLKPGDLVFFTSPRSGSNPGHVGLVTRHDEEGIFFIHSSSSRGVVEDRLDAFYRKKYLAARRILIP